ncbi:hypothetical protein [Bradyrhizobium iriomotense]|nr:hypothetical protein [Bradyrhizobium iriomotense]
MVVPVVVTEEALDVVELVVDVLLVLELTLVTLVSAPSQRKPGRPHAGPA